MTNENDPERIIDSAIKAGRPDWAAGRVVRALDRAGYQIGCASGRHLNDGRCGCQEIADPSVTDRPAPDSS